MRGEDLYQELIILYTNKFSRHERGSTMFYDNHPCTTNKRLEVTKICIIINERGKENENRVFINKTDKNTHYIKRNFLRLSYSQGFHTHTYIQ